MDKQIETTELGFSELDAVAGGWSISVGSDGVSVSAFGVTVSTGKHQPDLKTYHQIGTCPR